MDIRIGFERANITEGLTSPAAKVALITNYWRRHPGETDCTKLAADKRGARG